MNTLKKTAGAALLLGSLVCLVWMVCSTTQSVLSKPMQLHFAGEYSPDGEHWQTLEGADLSRWEGDLYLRGHFDWDIPEGLRISWYQDHIGVSMTVNGQPASIDTVAWYMEKDGTVPP